MSARVAVNLLWLVPGKVGGSEEYLTRLLRGVAQHPPDDLDVELFVAAPFVEAHPDLAEAFPTRVWPGDGHSKTHRVLAENTWLGSRLRAGGFELVHHGGGVIPAANPTPAIVTIHDLQPLVLPANFHPVKRAYLGTMLPRSVAKARLVLTPSDQVGRTVVDLLGVAPARVRTVPHGIEPVTGGNSSACAAVRRRYGLGDRFFLYPAVTYPHKNHVLLVQAFAEVVAERPDVHLVLTGGASTGEEALLGEIDRLGLGGSVHRLGRIARADVDALFDGATALTFPSRFEGFGAPVLEAMARGCPVIASDAASLPEVLGGAGLLVSPDDLGGWSHAMLGLLDNPARCRQMGNAGRHRAQAFSWGCAATALTDAYRSALGQGSGSR